MSLTGNREGWHIDDPVPDQCPLCGSTNVDWSNEVDPDYFDFGNGLAWRQGVCSDCNTIWEEQYDLKRIYLMHDGPYYHERGEDIG